MNSMMSGPDMLVLVLTVSWYAAIVTLRQVLAEYRDPAGSPLQTERREVAGERVGELLALEDDGKHGASPRVDERRLLEEPRVDGVQE